MKSIKKQIMICLFVIALNSSNEDKEIKKICSSKITVQLKNDSSEQSTSKVKFIEPHNLLSGYNIQSNMSMGEISYGNQFQRILTHNIDQSRSNQSGSNQSGSNQSGSNQSRSNQSGSNQSGSNQSGSNQSGSNQSRSNQSGSNQSGSNQSGSNQSGSNQSGSNQSRSNQSGSNQSLSNQSGSNQSRSNQSGSNQSGSNQSGSNQSRSNQSRSNQSGSNQSRSNQSGSNQSVSNQSGSNQNSLSYSQGIHQIPDNTSISNKSLQGIKNREQSINDLESSQSFHQTTQFKQDSTLVQNKEGNSNVITITLNDQNKLSVLEQLRNLKKYKDKGSEFLDYQGCDFDANDNSKIYIKTELLTDNIHLKRNKFRWLSDKQRYTHYVKLLKIIQKVHNENQVLVQSLNIMNLMTTSSMDNNGYNIKFRNYEFIVSEGMEILMPNISKYLIATNLFPFRNENGIKITVADKKMDIINFMIIIFQLDYGLHYTEIPHRLICNKEKLRSDCNELEGSCLYIDCDIGQHGDQLSCVNEGDNTYNLDCHKYIMRLLYFRHILYREKQNVEYFKQNYERFFVENFRKQNDNCTDFICWMFYVLRDIYTVPDVGFLLTKFEDMQSNASDTNTKTTNYII